MQWEALPQWGGGGRIRNQHSVKEEKISGKPRRDELGAFERVLDLVKPQTRLGMWDHVTIFN